MNRDILKQIIIDQKEMYLDNSLISRDYDLEENVNYCFVGIRRTGKFIYDVSTDSQLNE